MPHNILLHQLKCDGIKGDVLQWLDAFLTNRQQHVIVEGETSSPTDVNSGVPQGTCLGPILFLCFINSLPESVKSCIRLFADDCVLYRKVLSINDQQVLQEDLHRLAQWATMWGMRFNETKCFVISFHRTTPRSFFYSMNTTILKQVCETKYLGIEISNTLKWSSHISNITKQANSTLGFLRRNLKYCPRKSKETAYIALVRSKLEYCTTTWDPYLQQDIIKIENVLRRAARFVIRDYHKRSSVTQMMKQLEWKPLATRRKHFRLILMYKIIHELVAITPSDIKFHTGPTRSSTARNIRKLRTNTDIYKHSFFPQTINDWNFLDISITSLPLSEFKTAIINIVN